MKFFGKQKARTSPGTLPAEIPEAEFFDFFLLAFGKRQRFKVKGNSMIPLLFPDDQVLAVNLSDKELVKDSIVVCQHPFEKRLIIKKLVDVGTDFVSVSSINESDGSSFVFGRENIVGRVVCKF